MSGDKEETPISPPETSPEMEPPSAPMEVSSGPESAPEEALEEAPSAPEEPSVDLKADKPIEMAEEISSAPAQSRDTPVENVPVAPQLDPVPEKYPSTFVQDDVGRALGPQSTLREETQHLISTDTNKLATNDVRWRGGAAPEEDLEDPDDSGKPEVPGLDEMLTGDYFTLMGFLFKMNDLRLTQKQVPVAIAMLLVIYILVALYVLYVLLGVMMIHIAVKYGPEECDQNLSQWMLVTGVYICISFGLNLGTMTTKLLWKKEPLAPIQHIGTLFAFVWFIVGCVRVYKIDSDEYTCPSLLFLVSYYYCTILLSLIGVALGLVCIATCVVAAKRGNPEDDL